jgi:hypothetical protein
VSTNPNPFIHSRREYERDMPIYIPGGKSGFPEWISDQQYLFEGVRGSGKSSILQSMNWEVTWLSQTKLVVSKDVVKSLYRPPRHLGICYPFELEDRSNWDHWELEIGTEWAQKYFGTYLEYLLLDLFLNSLVNIFNKKKESFIDLYAENKVVQEILQIAFPDPVNRPRLSEYSFDVLKYTIRDRHIAIRDLVYKNTSAEELKKTYPVLSPGSLVQSFANSLRVNCPKCSNMMFFPMLDDCNHLEEWQLQVVNSAILKARIPVSYKVTSVRGLYKTRITQDGRPLNEHELKTMRLSSDKEGRWVDIKKFEPVMKGVLNTRIEKIYGKQYADLFDPQKILGKFDIEELLVERLSMSENPLAAKLLSQAKQRSEQQDSKLSITTTWMLNHNIRSYNSKPYPNPEMEKQRKRLLRSSYLNKWKYSVAVAICRELNIKYPYCGWSTVLHLGCMSIREVLRIFYEIWEAGDFSIDNLVKQNGINPQIQTQGIINAANKLFASLETNPAFMRNQELLEKSNAGVKTYYLPIICDRLGKLFATFQSDPYIGVTAETASIKVDENKLDKITRDAINFGVMSSALLLYCKDSTLSIGLNPILSPRYNIAYRNPFYYPQTVSPEDFVVLFHGSEREASVTIEKILKNRISKRDSEGQLAIEW